MMTRRVFPWRCGAGAVAAHGIEIVGPGGRMLRPLLRRPESGGPAANTYGFRKNVKVEVVGALLVVKCDGIPDHTTGDFPNPNNPNRILKQDYTFNDSAHAGPKLAEKVIRLPMGPTGVAINGIPFYNPYNTKGWTPQKRSISTNAAAIPIRWGGITITSIPSAFIRHLWISPASIRR